jgi:hypothetical protein
MPSLLHAALGYACAGIPVLPIHTPAADGGCSCREPECASPGKHPRVRRGVHASTTDPWCCADGGAGGRPRTSACAAA